MIERLAAWSLRVPFRETFRHASAERRETASVWVEASGGGQTGFGEGCPRPYVTGETLASAGVFLEAHERSVRESVTDLSSLRHWMDSHRADVDANPAAWCAVELAVLDLLARQADCTIDAFVGLPPLTGRFQYTAVLGDADADAFRAAGERYRAHGFRDYKVKLSGDVARDRAKAEWLRTLGEDVTVRADANNLWSTVDDALHALERLGYTFTAVEEPLRAGQYDDMRRLAEALGCRIVLDESVASREQLAALRSTADSWLVNVRVSKMGGLVRSLEVVEAARLAGLGVIVGAHVGETSVLTRAALSVAAAARDVLHAQEGAFGTRLLTTDVCEPPVMFGAGGRLDAAQDARLSAAGLGIAVTLPPTCRVPLG